MTIFIDRYYGDGAFGLEGVRGEGRYDVVVGTG